MRNGLHHIIDHGDRVRITQFLHPQDHSRFPVDADRFRLFLVTILDTRDVPNADGNPSAVRKDVIADRLDEIEKTFRLQRIIEDAAFEVSGGYDQIRILDRRYDLRDRKPKRLNTVAIDHDMNLANTAPGYLCRRNAIQVLELRLDGIVGEIVEIALVHLA